ncbi:MAG: FlgD immunoglobulin-like domain containing protein [bacterium]|nr:FlgD immunoglobulin-like domain containing protein [bacterium]
MLRERYVKKWYLLNNLGRRNRVSSRNPVSTHKCPEILRGYKKCLFLSTLLIFISFHAPCYSADYGMSWTAFTQGGGSRGSENYKVTDGMGLAVGEVSSSERYRVESVLYLPAPEEEGPTATITLDPPGPVGPGKVKVALTTSEEVEGIPTLEFIPEGGSPIQVELSGSGTSFTGEIEITESTGIGLARFSYTAKSKESGKTSATITEGEYLEITTIEAASVMPVNNLFNPTEGEYTTIKYNLDKPTQATIKIYDLMGELVKTLVDEAKDPGSYEVNWDGKNKDEKEVASGVYILRIEAGGFTDTKKIIVIK